MNALTNRCWQTVSDATEESLSPRALYFQLLADFAARRPTDFTDTKESARFFLKDQLVKAATSTDYFPESLQDLDAWSRESFTDTGLKYREYLKDRRAGTPPRYFSRRSHALDFLRKSAPTKLVDGSWLYGVLTKWNDPRFSGLIRTYLEELGDGIRTQNHVALYRELLAEHGCSDWTDLDDSYFIQGAIQLALAALPDEFLPEIVGFNLGYEQLPLHLPVTAYELAEQGIDPYYFTLHITIDNPDTGHAHHALASVQAMAAAEPPEFLARVKNGYLLNSMGVGATAIADSFDLEREVLALLARKAQVGQYLHCDRCKIQGRSINDWLAKPGGMPDFLQAMQVSGWIKRHEDPSHSRFWQLLDGEKPLMFGVFDAREKQILFDWISGDWKAPGQPTTARRRKAEVLRPVQWQGDDPMSDAACIQRGIELTAQRDPALTIHSLISNMSPALHDMETGLNATRIFAEYFYRSAPRSLPAVAER
jgi:hypothetical protein